MKLKKAFTLVELLIAALISSLIFLSLYSAFHSGILSYNRLDCAFKVYQTARVILNRMELDLKNSFAYAKEDSRFGGSSGDLDFFSLVDSHIEGKNYQDVYRIKYELIGETLKRTLYKDLDALKINPELPLEDELSSEVKEISFKYAYLTGNPDKPYDWQECWPGRDERQKKNLPLAVKIKLSLLEKTKTGKESRILEFNRTIFLPSSGISL